MGDGRSRRGSGVLSLHRSSPLISEDDCFFGCWFEDSFASSSYLLSGFYKLYYMSGQASESVCQRLGMFSCPAFKYLSLLFLFVFFSINVPAAMLLDFKLFLEETFE